MGVVESIAFGVAILLILVGALGTVIPVLPGLPLIWLLMVAATVTLAMMSTLWEPVCSAF